MGYCIKGQPPDNTLTFLEDMFGPLQPWQKAILDGITDPLPPVTDKDDTSPPTKQ